jgi:hypothetical protein
LLAVELIGLGHVADGLAQIGIHRQAGG